MKSEIEQKIADGDVMAVITFVDVAMQIDDEAKKCDNMSRLLAYAKKWNKETQEKLLSQIDKFDMEDEEVKSVAQEILSTLAAAGNKKAKKLLSQ